MQLSPTQQQRLFDLLQTAHLDQQYSLPLEINALPTGLKQIAIAIYFSDFVADTLHKYPNLFQQWLASPPQFSDCDNYQQRLREKLAEITDETQLYQILRHFRHHEMAKLSFCQSLNLASVEQIFRQLSALAEAIIVVTKDWFYE